MAFGMRSPARKQHNSFAPGCPEDSSLWSCPAFLREPMEPAQSLSKLAFPCFDLLKERLRYDPPMELDEIASCRVFILL